VFMASAAAKAVSLVARVFMCISLRKWLLSFDGVMLCAILPMLTQYSANGGKFPVNDGGEASFVFSDAVKPFRCAILLRSSPGHPSLDARSPACGSPPWRLPGEYMETRTARPTENSRLKLRKREADEKGKTEIGRSKEEAQPN
jgi:hypothetical protein